MNLVVSRRAGRLLPISGERQTCLADRSSECTGKTKPEFRQAAMMVSKASHDNTRTILKAIELLSEQNQGL